MVRWTLAAAQDLEEIHAFIAQDSALYAARVAEAIVERVRSLEAFPLRGRKIPDIKSHEYREVFVHSYRIIFRVERPCIYILAVLHGKRLLTEDMIKDTLEEPEV
jgi:toxin ParE1/3/4